MLLPIVAFANVNVGVPVNVASSPTCTSDSPALTGTVTWPLASVVASYWRLAMVNVPVTVSGRAVMFAVFVAVLFGV